MKTQGCCPSCYWPAPAVCPQHPGQFVRCLLFPNAHTLSQTGWNLVYSNRWSPRQHKAQEPQSKHDYEINQPARGLWRLNECSHAYSCNEYSSYPEHYRATDFDSVWKERTCMLALKKSITPPLNLQYFSWRLEQVFLSICQGNESNKCHAYQLHTNDRFNTAVYTSNTIQTLHFNFIRTIPAAIHHTATHPPTPNNPSTHPLTHTYSEEYWSPFNV